MPWYPRGLQANSILSSEGSDPFRCFVFFWSPGFCLCPFEKVPSDHVVLFSHQNAFLRVPKPSKMSPPREGESKITCFSSPGKELDITNPAISSELELGSERLVVDKNGRNTTPRARKTEGCRSRPAVRPADPPGPSTAPMDGAQHRLLSGFPPVIVSQAPMKWRVYWEGLAPGIRLASRCRRLPSSHNRDDIPIVLLHIVMGDGVVE